ncbi:serine hydrolase domain-containing protein [Agromyces seonyuensis]|uniref:Serine hydrolase n=1 Tax=Agromyces seonyuensis TaxID=2662446 RepID=A0A6I4P4T9_9MICO|nr:serine hydrolase domain-containing protein [Agromyces seonyuensis]MWB99369.1 serine hydrolase [Agromyces seonyuensis]
MTSTDPTTVRSDAPAAADVSVHGTADPRFDALREEFARRLANGDELGASIAVRLDGEPVVDLWGGSADPERTRPWEADTLTNVWSISKTVSALAALVLVDRGELDLDAPVARYWPEFGAAGKSEVTVRQLLSHRSGVSGWAQPIDAAALFDVEAAEARLAAQEPWWPAGTASGYCLLGYGHLVDALVRRVDGRDLGAFVADELAGPLGADFHLGLPESEDARVSDVIPPVGTLDLAAIPPESVAFRTLTGPVLPAELTWTRAWRAAGFGGAGGQSNARAVALLAELVACGGEAGGVRLLSPGTVDEILASTSDGVDLVLGLPLRFGIGFATPHPITNPGLPEGRLAYWGGWGGSLIVADPDRRLAVGYVMNRMSPGIIGSERSDAYTRAIFAALD